MPPKKKHVDEGSRSEEEQQEKTREDKSREEQTSADSSWKLPLELLVEIAHHLSSVHAHATLSCLSLSSKHLQKEVLPVLWKTVTLDKLTPSGWHTTLCRAKGRKQAKAALEEDSMAEDRRYALDWYDVKGKQKKGEVKAPSGSRYTKFLIYNGEATLIRRIYLHVIFPNLIALIEPSPVSLPTYPPTQIPGKGIDMHLYHPVKAAVLFEEGGVVHTPLWDEDEKEFQKAGWLTGLTFHPGAFFRPTHSPPSTTTASKTASFQEPTPAEATVTKGITPFSCTVQFHDQPWFCTRRWLRDPQAPEDRIADRDATSIVELLKCLTDNVEFAPLASPRGPKHDENGEFVMPTEQEMHAVLAEASEFSFLLDTTWKVRMDKLIKKLPKLAETNTKIKRTILEFIPPDDVEQDQLEETLEACSTACGADGPEFVTSKKVKVYRV